jgi:sodium/bile acid cotransporter 7
MIVASVPCTTAAASVMTRKARGNDAISLLTSIATNMACFVLTPLWLHATTATEVNLPLEKMMVDLLVAVVLPTVAGQILRRAARLHAFVARHKAAVGVTAQVLIELMVVTAALGAGHALHSMGGTSASSAVADEAPGTFAAAPPRNELTSIAVVFVWGSCVAIHLAALATGWWLARRTGHRRSEAAAVAFAGSQKTLPIGLLLATDPAMFGSADAGVPFAVFPILMYHASQLFVDTLVADRVAINGATDAAEEAIAAVD